MRQSLRPPLLLPASLLALLLLDGTAALSCEAFTSCSDCACATFDYSVKSSCVRGCAWVPELRACHSNQTTTSLPTVRSFYQYPLLATTERARHELLSNGLTACPLQTGSGAVATIVVAAVVAVIGFAVLVRAAIPSSKAYQPLLRAAERLIPEGENVQLQDVRTSNPRHLHSFIWLLHASCTVIPVAIWLGVGLPVTVQPSWQAGFFLSLLLPVGADLVLLVTLPLGYRMVTAEGQAFILTERYLIGVTGIKTLCGALRYRRRWVLAINNITQVSFRDSVAHCVIRGTRGPGDDFFGTAGADREHSIPVALPSTMAKRVFSVLHSKCVGEASSPLAAVPAVQLIQVIAKPLKPAASTVAEE